MFCGAIVILIVCGTTCCVCDGCTAVALQGNRRKAETGRCGKGNKGRTRQEDGKREVGVAIVLYAYLSSAFKQNLRARGEIHVFVFE